MNKRKKGIRKKMPKKLYKLFFNKIKVSEKRELQIEIPATFQFIWGVSEITAKFGFNLGDTIIRTPDEEKLTKQDLMDNVGNIIRKFGNDFEVFESKLYKIWNPGKKIIINFTETSSDGNFEFVTYANLPFCDVVVKLLVDLGLSSKDLVNAKVFTPDGKKFTESFFMEKVENIVQTFGSNFIIPPLKKLSPIWK